MSIWTRISEALAALAQGESLSTVFDKLRGAPQQSIAFTIAVIGLGAKIAKADGLVTRDEVAAFREVFDICDADSAHAARVYNLARQDVTGFDAYARQIASMFNNDRDTLLDLLEGLFHIAMADGDFHPSENLFLQEVASIFGLSERDFARMRSRLVPNCAQDPYDVLGVSPDASPEELRKAWRSLVRENHPDRMRARGVPEEAMRIAEKRLIAINNAWEIISGKTKMVPAE